MNSFCFNALRRLPLGLARILTASRSYPLAANIAQSSDLDTNNSGCSLTVRLMMKETEQEDEVKALSLDGECMRLISPQLHY